MKRRHAMPFGAQLNADGTTRFRLWATSARRVAVACNHGDSQWRSDMQALPDGWHELTRGVRNRSEAIDPLAFEWRDDAWCGRPWH